MTKTNLIKPSLKLVETTKQKTRKAFIAKAHEYRIPAHNIPGLADFFMDGVPLGSFLAAVLSNDLRLACCKADIENQAAIWDIVNFCYNAMPHNSWGSAEAYNGWIKFHQEARKKHVA